LTSPGSVAGIAGQYVATWVGRFGVSRLFARWLHGLDPTYAMPPKGFSAEMSMYSRRENGFPVD
jgi:hypothetical protein